MLTTGDRVIVQKSLEKVTPELAPNVRAIHERALDKLRPQYEAMGRAIAMREACLQLLTERGF